MVLETAAEFACCYVCLLLARVTLSSLLVSYRIILTEQSMLAM